MLAAKFSVKTVRFWRFISIICFYFDILPQTLYPKGTLDQEQCGGDIFVTISNRLNRFTALMMVANLLCAVFGIGLVVYLNASLLDGQRTAPAYMQAVLLLLVFIGSIAIFAPLLFLYLGRRLHIHGPNKFYAAIALLLAAGLSVLMGLVLYLFQSLTPLSTWILCLPVFLHAGLCLIWSVWVARLSLKNISPLTVQ